MMVFRNENIEEVGRDRKFGKIGKEDAS